jgi:nucleoid-associated protein YgaU
MVKQGDTLIAMANKIYKRNDYYMDVARKNELDNFRKLKSGESVYFPPIQNTK